MRLDKAKLEERIKAQAHNRRLKGWLRTCEKCGNTKRRESFDGASMTCLKCERDIARAGRIERQRHEVWRACDVCGETKSRSAFLGSKATVCIQCSRDEYLTKSNTAHGKYCPKCCSMSWRVVGRACSVCGLQFREQVIVKDFWDATHPTSNAA